MHLNEFRKKSHFGSVAYYQSLSITLESLLNAAEKDFWSGGTFFLEGVEPPEVGLVKTKFWLEGLIVAVLGLEELSLEWVWMAVL